jgi:glycogen debranching enzyme
MKKTYYPLFFLLLLCSCKEAVNNENFKTLSQNSPRILGTTAYLNSPYVTAGNRVYMVGHQDGTFPEIGWHIKGEMGGIWNHPIKLMDGFKVDINIDNEIIPLEKAAVFTNFPFANQHLYELKNNNLTIERWQFVPDDEEGIVVQFILKNLDTKAQNFTLDFTGYSDLRPTWLGERTNMIDAPDKAVYNAEKDSWVIKDDTNPWFVTFGSSNKSTSKKTAAYHYSGKGTAAMLSYDINLSAKEEKTIAFVIAGSYTSENEALATYKNIQENNLDYFIEKQLRYQQLASQSKLTIPDKQLQETFEWLKYNSDWLVRTVPEIGSGITAGIPDYPWWFGVDSEYALKGYMAIGQKDAVYNTIQLLDSLSEVTNGNGRIIHEVSTNGAVFNKGNINETPQFASLIWEIYQWNGDKAFLEKYFPTIEKGLTWLLKENDANGNLFPDGFGMMEIHGLDSEMIDVAVYTQRAFSDASKMASILDKKALAQEYEKTASLLKNKINAEFWSEEFNSYADFIGTDQQALHLIEDAIIRADTLNKPWSVAELQQTKKSISDNPSKEPRPFVLHHNWVVNTPMEMKIADPDKAIRALKTAEQFVNPFGVFVTGIDRDESAGSDDGSFKGSKIFSYTGAVMTLPTGVQAIAENNYGRPNDALNYLKRMSRTFSYALPGSMYEVSPDYGMIAQAWNIYSFAIPIVQQFFGIQPQAAQKKITISPQMPDEWNEASLENVLVSDNAISIFYEKNNGKLQLKITQDNPDWEIEIILPQKIGEKKYEVVKSTIEPSILNDQLIFKAKGKVIEIILNY